MKQKEKNNISKEKILNAALVEFGTQNYDNASLNNICNGNNISKGLIYHYFKDKDDLYLNCVKACYDELTTCLKNQEYNFDDFQEQLKKYLDLRYRFFSNNPYYSNIFFNSILQPPKHLIEQIKELRKEFDSLSISNYRAALRNITLRDDITEDEALEYFVIFQEMFNGYFQSKAYENSDFNALIEAHELKLSKLLNIMLYGIAKEETKL